PPSRETHRDHGTEPRRDSRPRRRSPPGPVDPPRRRLFPPHSLATRPRDARLSGRQQRLLDGADFLPPRLLRNADEAGRGSGGCKPRMIAAEARYYALTNAPPGTTPLALVQKYARHDVQIFAEHVIEDEKRFGTLTLAPMHRAILDHVRYCW